MTRISTSLLLASLLWHSQGEAAENLILNIELTESGSVLLSWPSSQVGYLLEETGDLSNWFILDNPTILAEGLYQNEIDPVVGSRFFRLISPSLLSVLDTGPFDGESGVAVTRKSTIDFDLPLAESSTVTGQHVYAESGGQLLDARIQLSSDGRSIALFYDETLPPSSTITVTINGDGLLDLIGREVDFDGDGAPGGFLQIQFQTLSITPIAGTAVMGRVWASEFVEVEGEITNQNLPLEGATITVDGAEETLNSVTDAAGNFILDPSPAGRFFVHIDGRTAQGSDWPDGDYYPFVGKSWEAIGGRDDNNVGDIYRPLVTAGTLQEVSNSSDTVVEFPAGVLAEQPELVGVSITVPAGSLYSDDGTFGGQVGIAPVDPSRLPGALPEDLQFALVITVQTDGPTNFDVPTPVRFPNLPDPVTGELLPPGAKSALWSFNHDTGRWEIQGSMTVSDDGLFVVSDPGVGITAPGWHGTLPGSPGSGGGGGSPNDSNEDPCLAKKKLFGSAIAQCEFAAATSGIGFAWGAGCLFSAATALGNSALDCNIDPSSCGCTLATNAAGGLVGCIPGPAGPLFACGYQVDAARRTLADCIAVNSSSQGSPLGALEIGEDEFANQIELNEALSEIYLIVLGDPVWAGSDPLGAVQIEDFVIEVYFATTPESDLGVLISESEEQLLDAMPLPNEISTVHRNALHDRLEAMAAGTFTFTQLEVD